MSFADELRREPERQRNEMDRQNAAQWEKIAKTLVDEMKEACRYYAGKGRTDWSFRVWELISNIYEERYTDISERFVDGRWVEEISFDDSQEGIFWENMRDNFYHHTKAYGMNRDKAERLGTILSDKLKAEGLIVDMRVIKYNTIRQREYFDVNIKVSW